MPDACLWNKDGIIRPPGQVWVDLTTKQWWTNADGKTAGDGLFFFAKFNVGTEIALGRSGDRSEFKLQLVVRKSTLKRNAIKDREMFGQFP